MKQELGQVVLVVKEYDEAIEYYTDVLGFELVEDTAREDKRWVIVKPREGKGASLLLARAKNPEQRRCVGHQTGGRVAFFLYTDNFSRDYDAMRKAGVEFIGKPRYEEYGTVIVFKDLYGNKWDFIEKTEATEFRNE